MKRTTNPNWWRKDKKINEILNALTINKEEVEKVLMLTTRDLIVKFIDGHTAKFQMRKASEMVNV